MHLDYIEFILAAITGTQIYLWLVYAYTRLDNIALILALITVAQIYILFANANMSCVIQPANCFVDGTHFRHIDSIDGQ